MRSELPRACIIGAGCAGFTTAKRLKDHGIPFDCYEMSDDIGGNWYFENPNGLSACYRSLHIDTSKWRLAFEDFPVPADWPDYPHNSLILKYFHDYVAHFGLRPHIRFNTAVQKARRNAEGLWEVSLSNGQTLTYDLLFVCNGHHWSPRTPEYPGAFTGEVFHSHSYRDPFNPVDMRGKRVLIVGIGNSAMDIASELSARGIGTQRVLVSTRRGVWIFPKYVAGRPFDKRPKSAWMPRWLAARLVERKMLQLQGPMENYGLPKPEQDPLSAHGSVSGEFLLRAGSGDLTVKPAVKALEGGRVRFVDDTVEDIDVIIYATGYNISFPFLDDPALKPDAENRFPLFKRMMKPGYPNLFFMGLAQATPTLVNFPEQQSKLVAAYLMGRYALPSEEEMRRVIAKDEARFIGHYYKSPRHTIQVDFVDYVNDLKKEMARGARRAAAQGHRLPVPARAAPAAAKQRAPELA